MNPYTLRPSTLADLDLTYEITKDAMKEYVVATWGAWDEDEQREKHRLSFTPATHRIVVSQGAEVGIVAVEQGMVFVRLVKLYLKSGFRGVGLGSDLLESVLKQADAIAKPVRLRVLRVNVRAQRFYATHGFSVIDEEPERLFMEWAAS